MNVYTSEEIKVEKEQKKIEESIQNNENSSKVYETDEYVEPDITTFEEEISAPENEEIIEKSTREQVSQSTKESTKESSKVPKESSSVSTNTEN